MEEIKATEDGKAEEQAQKAPGLSTALGAGLIGAATMTALHEGLRHQLSRAPRLDQVGQRGVAKLSALVGQRPPKGEHLYQSSLAADLLANAVYYGAILRIGRRRPWLAGTVAGLLAGGGALALPQQLGLGFATQTQPAKNKTGAALTAGLYLVGGLVAAAVFRAAAKPHA